MLWLSQEAEAFVQHDAVHPSLGIRCLFQRMTAAYGPVCTILHDITGICFIADIAVCDAVVLIVVLENQLLNKLLIRVFTGKYVHFFHLLGTFCMIRPPGAAKSFMDAKNI